MKVPIGKIEPNPFQVRKRYDRESIQALANEIKELGMWGALRARKHGSSYELAFGHRRLAALKLLKTKDVEIEVVDLSDDDMATQAVVENLQREGLTDIEKAEGLKFLIERFDQDGKRGGRTRVAGLVGLSVRRIDDLVGLLLAPVTIRKLIENRVISGATATVAKQLGGEKMVKTAVKLKLAQHTISKMAQEVAAIPEPKIREQVKKAVISGRVRDPESVREHERKVRRQIAKKSGTNVPPDLRFVIRTWTKDIIEWNKKLDAVIPYRDYIDEDKELAAAFRSACRDLIKKLEKFF